MATSNPNVIPPAGGGDPDEKAPMNQGEEAPPGPLWMSGQLEGATPSADDPDTPEGTSSALDPDSDTDSVDADRKRSGAD